MASKHSALAVLYGGEILAGNITIEDVPARLQPGVEDYLAEQMGG